MLFVILNYNDIKSERQCGGTGLCGIFQLFILVADQMMLSSEQRFTKQDSVFIMKALIR